MYKYVIWTDSDMIPIFLCLILFLYQLLSLYCICIIDRRNYPLNMESKIIIVPTSSASQHVEIIRLNISVIYMLGVVF